MAFGITALNNNSETLISSEYKNLHFINKITSPTSTQKQTTLFGGRAIHTYRISNCPSIPVPFLHMDPIDKAGIISIKPTSVANQWDIEVLTSNHEPTVYVFADASSLQHDDDFGLAVYGSDGAANFDSRARPFAVVNAVNTTLPPDPRINWNASLNAKYCADNGTTTMSNQAYPDAFEIYNVANLPEKPMFFYFSVGQCEREAEFYTKEQECDSFSIYNECVALGRNYEWWSTYWIFYRATMTWQPGQIGTHWTMAEYDCYWRHEQDSQSFGFDTGGSSDAGGAFPLSNKTINVDSNIIIIGDASRYD